jgi:flavin-binding protein dodecin
VTGTVRDPDSVHRVLTLVATHPTSWEDAAAVAIADLGKTIRDLRVARVVELDTSMRDGQVTSYRLKLEVSYRIDRRRRVDGRVETVRRCLVVANRTVGSPALAAAIRDRLAAGPVELHVVVPARIPPLASTAMMSEPLTGYAAVAGDEVAALHEEAEREADQRLRRELDRFRDLGATASGEVALGDPVDAVAGVLARGAFDEIIVSTLPGAVSRWMRIDLPRRLQRRFGLPVTHVEQPG